MVGDRTSHPVLRDQPFSQATNLHRSVAVERMGHRQEYVTICGRRKHLSFRSLFEVVADNLFDIVGGIHGRFLEDDVEIPLIDIF